MDALRPGNPAPVPMKHACVSCARRKIRCDRLQPCSNCVAQARTAARRSRHFEHDANSKQGRLDVGCVYVEPPPVQRHRRRATPRSAATVALADDLLNRLSLYEDLLRKNNISVPESPATSQQQQLPRPLSREKRTEPCEDAEDVDDSMWIPSPWEAKLAMSKPPSSAAQTPSSAAETLVISEAAPSITIGSLPGSPEEDSADVELKLWRSLPAELRNPPVSSVFARRFFGHTNLQTDPERPAESRCLPTRAGLEEPSLSIAQSLSGVASPVCVQHPDPRIILRLWQVFVDNVNPIMRIVHVPTTHQQIIDASWDPDNAPPVTAALLFAIYTLALTSMSPAEYAETFRGAKSAPPPNKSDLLQRFRTGAMQSLLAAGLLTTRRFDVLQAFTLVVLAEPDSELSSTLAAIAVHLGLKIGLHHETGSSYSNDNSSSSNNGDGSLPFFEREMRVRLWWQIRGIDARMRQAISLSYTNSLSNLASGNGVYTGNHFSRGLLPPPDLGEIRLPLNVNDADLHPDMAGPPMEHTGPTEMLYVRMKYETAIWMRAFAQKKFVTGPRLAMEPPTSECAAGSAAAAQRYRAETLPDMKDRAIDDLERLYDEKCLKHCDIRIPLHAVTASMARAAVAQLRFQAHHPRTTAPQGATGSAPNAFTKRNADAAFRHALSLLELCFACRHAPRVGNSFAAFQLLADIMMRLLLDATVYVVCMLRVRTGSRRDGKDGSNVDESNDSGRIDVAWRMVELFYAEYRGDLAMAATDYEQRRLQTTGEPPVDMGTTKPNSSNQRSKGEVSEESRQRAAGTAFVTAFTDLTLEAWAAREDSFRPDVIQIPQFILDLQSQKASQKDTGVDDIAEQPFASVDIPDWGGLSFHEDLVMDWDHWNNFLQI